MAVQLRRLFLVATPLALAAALLWHPPGGGDTVYRVLRDDVDAHLFVHTASLLLIPLLGIAIFLLLNGLRSAAATVSRVALLLFLVFYTAFEVTLGIGTADLVDHANELPAGEQAVVANAIEDYHSNAIVGEPSIASVVGVAAWAVAMLAAAVAFRRAGAGWPATVLVGAAVLFALHPPPTGPIGLVCLAAAAVLIERWRARQEFALSSRPTAPAGLTTSA
jgi:hypothetical protein